MPVPERSTTPTQSAGLHWQTTDDGSRTLWDEGLNETYHSGCGAVAESLIVYLQNSGIHRRLRLGQESAVLEYGFGTATAFLLTAADALMHRVSLRYRALELSLLPAEVFGELNLSGSLLDPQNASEFGEVLSVAQTLLGRLVEWRTTLPARVAQGAYTCSLEQGLELEVVVGNAVDYTAQSGVEFDAIYFDPFSPASCPELWSGEVFQVAFQSLRRGGTLTSYCVKSSVRRELAAVGFDIERLPGPVGGKREVLLAYKPTN